MNATDQQRGKHLLARVLIEWPLKFTPEGFGESQSIETITMTIRFLSATFTGINPLLQNNPQTVDRFNPYARAMKKINDKKTRRTDDDYLELKNIEVRSKIYWDDDMGIYIPANWVTAAIAANSFKSVKISKADVRSAVFVDGDKLKLTYRDMDKVKSPDDIVLNDGFRLDMTLKQGQVRVVKSIPIFHNWSFATDLEYDDEVIDAESMSTIINKVAKYGGFGDFRPTFGRATVEIRHE
uniref:hypothetical protein n=1 Tax=Comamonas testosteroni TaxID=285 RepID=UPI001E3DFA09|nr:hypothetical protein [Comamonas testosteroni]